MDQPWPGEAQKDRCHYETLGISEKATKEDVKSAYREAAARWHPDKHMGANKEMATRQFHLVKEAYETLSNDSYRRAYDAHRAQYKAAQWGPNASTKPFPAPKTAMEDVENMYWKYQQYTKAPGKRHKFWGLALGLPALIGALYLENTFRAKNEAKKYEDINALQRVRYDSAVVKRMAEKQERERRKIQKDIDADLQAERA
eukprot:Clim_evm64s109 gene=Clim_evmTU64s109